VVELLLNMCKVLCPIHRVWYCPQFQVSVGGHETHILQIKDKCNLMALDAVECNDRECDPHRASMDTCPVKQLYYRCIRHGYWGSREKGTGALSILQLPAFKMLS
jgi:hypothetical protein